MANQTLSVFGRIDALFNTAVIMSLSMIDIGKILYSFLVSSIQPAKHQDTEEQLLRRFDIGIKERPLQNPNPAYIRELIKIVNPSPFPEHMSMKLISIALDEHGELVAHGTSTLMTLPGKGLASGIKKFHSP